MSTDQESQISHQSGGFSFYVSKSSVQWNGREVENRFGRWAVQLLGIIVGLWAGLTGVFMGWA